MIRLFILLLHILATPLAAGQDVAGIIPGNAIYTAASGATDDVNNFYDSYSKEDYVDFLWANKALADQLGAEANRLFADDSYRDTLLNAGVFQDDFDINDRVEDLFNLSEGLNSLNRRSVPYARHFGNGVVSFADLWAGTDQNGTRPNIIASLHGQNVGTIAEAGVALSLAARSYINSIRGPNKVVRVGERAAEKITWVDENASMSSTARAYDDGATGARSNVETQLRQAPSLTRTTDDGGTAMVRFDGVDGDVLIDRKVSVVTTQKAKSQASRQSAALAENGLTARWEVPTQTEANRANRMFEELGIDNITVTVVP